MQIDKLNSDVTITKDWLLPITGFCINKYDFEEIKVELGDIVCQDILSINIKGDLKDLPEKNLSKIHDKTEITQWSDLLHKEVP